MSINGQDSASANAKVLNRGYSINKREEETGVDHYDKDCGNHWYRSYKINRTTALQTLDAIMYGNQGVSIDAPTIENLTINSAQMGATPTSVDPFKGNGSQPGLFDHLPDNQLFKQTQDPASPYVIKTDTRFAQYENFISSDYMLSQLNLDPAASHKRLGDGYYEQKLVRDQLLALSGKPALQGENATEQYKTLMPASRCWPGTTHRRQQPQRISQPIRLQYCLRQLHQCGWVDQSGGSGCWPGQ